MARPFYSAEQRSNIETQIRQTAMRLFAREGYRSTSLRAISREMGWSVTALYRYYNSKEALMATLRADGFKLLLEWYQRARQGDATPEAVVRRGFQAYLGFALEQPDLFRLMFELDQGDFGDVADVTEARRRAFGEGEAMARELLATLGLEGDANRLAHIIWVSAHGLATLALANQLDIGQRLDDLVEPVIRALLRGLINPGG